MMPPTKGILWNYFLNGEKQNVSHIWVHCRGCIENTHPLGEVVELDNDGNPRISSESWVVAGQNHLHSVLEELGC
jgi:hypothetical protein